MEQFKKKFIEDATDLIIDLEKSLLDLENEPNSEELIEQVFRVMHTLKGVSSMYGFDKISELTHHLETIYDFVREGSFDIDQKILNISLASVDHIRALLMDSDEQTEEIKKDHKALIEDVNKIVEGIKGKAEEDRKELKQKSPILHHPTEQNTYYILLTPDDNIGTRGINLQGIFDELNEMGITKAIPRTHPPEVIEKEKKFYMFWEIFIVTKEKQVDVENVFLFVDDEAEVSKIADKNILAIESVKNKLDELAEIPQVINIEDLKLFIAAINEQTTEIVTDLEEITAIEQGKTKAEPDKEKEKITIDEENNNTLEPEDKSKTEMPRIKKVDGKNGFGQELITSNIKVSSEKLDELMNLVSELVTTKAELSLIAQMQRNPQLESVAEKVEKLSKQFRDNALKIRLIPVNNLMGTFQRLVRDLSHELNKKVQFVIEGGDTELDKTIIDSISNPLVHIIRNSIDHGIEPEEIRLLKGKEAKGKITFKAFHESTNVVIQIVDDGSGINLDKVKQKAVEKGFITKNEDITERDLINLTFSPGFSTVENVSEVSGRGVGMDVVKQKIADIRGVVDLETIKDVGTTITIKLPQTLSIIDALLVRVDDTHFLIPLSVVDNCSESKHQELVRAVNSRVEIEGRLIPFIYLRKEFEIENNVPDYERLVLIKHEEEHIAIVVDEVVGEHQAVLKPLGEMFSNLDLISGASILGDGSVALVLDTNRLVKQIS